MAAFQLSAETEKRMSLLFPPSQQQFVRTILFEECGNSERLHFAARIVRQKVQPLALHRAAAAACDAPHFEFQDNPKSCARHVANLPYPCRTNPSGPVRNNRKPFFLSADQGARSAHSDPNTPRIVARARNPANEYPSDSRRRRLRDLAIPQHVKIRQSSKLKKSPIHKRFRCYDAKNRPTRFREDRFFLRRASPYIGRSSVAIGRLQSVAPIFTKRALPGGKERSIAEADCT